MPNRLAGETSLYLRQHANNPVDWYPWGPEAFARAHALDRPVFLSIGYSACHWCHVMEHESFENPAVAAVLNEHFVPVKVDREERPDVDHIYMTALQMLTSDGGGWPLSVFLNPDQTPFYAGTYYPPADNYGRPGFPRLLNAIRDAWQNRRAELSDVGSQVAASLAHVPAAAGAAPTEELLTRAGQVLARSFDPADGGFGRAPKFPHALELNLLLRLHARLGDGQALQMCRFTLEKMARGGMYDQVGGGFHRYSVDAKWLVPHFEKMLYDNALLPIPYADAFLVTGDPFYRQIACETLDYVLAEMTAPGGGFYSAQDADSEGEEGKFFVWTPDEIDAVLGADDGAFTRRVYGVSEHGNFEGHNILCRAATDEADAAAAGMTVPAFQERLDSAKRKLYAARQARVAPGRDEKILTAWNGLMIAAFAHCGRAFAEPNYVEAARRAAAFVRDNLRGADGRLFRTCGVGQPAKLTGYLEDYAFLADGLLELYATTYDAEYLTAAGELADVILARFPAPGGGFHSTADDHETLIARTCETHDGSTPSGNSVAATVLRKLAAVTGRADYRAAADAALAAGTRFAREYPSASGQMLAAVDFALGPVDEIAVVGPAGDAETIDVLRTLARQYRPNRVAAFHDPAAGESAVPLLRGKTAVGGRVTVYRCRNFACSAPEVGAAAAASL